MNLTELAMSYKFTKRCDGGGGGNGGAIEPNIAYGDTAPEDTSKLWVKTAQPTAVTAAPQVVYGKIEGESERAEKTTAVMYKPLYNFGCAAVGKKIYLLAGWQGATGSTASDVVYCFDTETDTCAEVGTMNFSGTTTAIAVGTKIYTVGYLQGSANNRINYYDTETNTAAYTGVSGSYNSAVAAIGNKIYIFGGSNSGNTIKRFDTETNTITTLGATLQDSDTGIAAATYNNKIYLFGGSSKTTRIQCFDAETETISVLSATMEYGSRFFYTSVINSKIYILCGESYGNKIRCFDPETETITTLGVAFPDDVSMARAATVGEDTYMLGGKVNGTVTDAIYYFGAGHSVLVNEGELYVATANSNNSFDLIKTDLLNVSVGASGVYKGNARGIGESVEACIYKNNQWQSIKE